MGRGVVTKPPSEDSALAVRLQSLRSKMPRPPTSPRPSRFSPRAALLCAFLAAIVSSGAGLPELRTAAEIRQLTAEQAALHQPVRIQGLVTYFEDTAFYRFIQDDTAGIYFFFAQPQTNPVVAGTRMEIVGEANPGEYAPIIAVRDIRPLGPGIYPAPKPVTLDQLASGQQDSQFVEVRGIVRAVTPVPGKGQFVVEIANGGGELSAFARQLPLAQIDDLVDSTVRIRGVCATRFNRQRQLFDIGLLVPRAEDLVVEIPAPNSVGLPLRSIKQLLQFKPGEPVGHRVKVTGTVAHRIGDTDLYLQDATEGLHVQTRQPGSLLPGDIVEVLGFPAKGGYTPMLGDAVFTRTSSGPAPQPDSISADSALKGDHDMRLVRLEGQLLDRAQHSREQLLVLQSDGFIFHAHLQRQGTTDDFAHLENGSKVAVTGICVVEPGSEWHAGEDWRAQSFRILLRSAGDVSTLALPPWWTLQRLAWIVGALGGGILGAFVWVAVLRRRVQHQTGIIQQKLEAEAALKERYEDLFENANDTVLTHDLSGRITSINKAGERLFQQPRSELVARDLADFVAENQRPAARRWLDQVAKGVELPPAEWDFINGADHRIKLEISARRIEQAGDRVEIESIARDVTERRQLEREILEISSREQRRIGHDIHDGVCQQLAGIAFLVDVLGERLEEKGVSESSDAEKIRLLLNEANSQARDIARGLFPVRLEEHGLVAALEELAAGASARFKLHCEFVCTSPPASVDSEVALHLYFIAQEAVSNAVKHGRAGNVTLSLVPAGTRYRLTVQDDGAGFSPPVKRSASMGLRIMRHRANVIGASLDLKSEPGSGTTVACEFNPASRNTGHE
jgi:PAS domain S-box-containing protein